MSVPLLTTTVTAESRGDLLAAGGDGADDLARGHGVAEGLGALHA